MVVTAAKGSHGALGNQLVKDFTGPGNFVYWFIAIGIIGAVAYLPKGEKLAKPFLALVLSAMILANKGFFAQFMAAMKSGPVAPPRDKATGSQSTASSGGNDGLKTAAKITGDVAQITGNVAKLAVLAI